jgi:[amino group carrier protein]-6-phospho-L-2-aminoadipate/5-phospho-L-glutamate reductase
MSERLRVGIAAASGYTGGELLRLLLTHSGVEVTQITSESSAGKFAHQIHPHLRGQMALRFITQDALQPVDVLFLAQPHGEAQKQIARYAELAHTIVDLSADFRLRDPQVYAETYGSPHLAPEWLERFVYGLPEINRAALRGARYASGVGCNATVTILAVWAAVKAGLLAPHAGNPTPDPSPYTERGENNALVYGVPLIADIKVGSSEAGKTPTDSSHHPARVGVVRPFQLTGHRHEAEVRQALHPSPPAPRSGNPTPDPSPYTERGESNRSDCFDVRMAITSVEMVRGAAAAVHITLPPGLPEKDLWSAYRTTWQDEPFVRIVHEKTGLHRHPEPRLLAGTNYADVGWEYEPKNGRAVLLAAIDNLGKGAAGSAVQCMNLMCGFDEREGLRFGGMYP